MGQSGSKQPPLKTVPSVSVSKMMGKWFVIGVMPTMFERGAYNAREIYSAGSKPHSVDVDFTYRKDAFDGPLKSLPQKGTNWLDDDPGAWKVSPFWPLKMPYLVIDASDAENLDQPGAWFVVGYPSRAYCWIMAREVTMKDDVYDGIKARLVAEHGYPDGLPALVKVPHKWDECAAE
mmetsp:Transcript_29083/g.93791  ORF Transcript_29083/g.93791 Transcript_29083/m.93791 type:complete len:177 (+) Transcript_29083:54-584(+)